MRSLLDSKPVELRSAVHSSLHAAASHAQAVHMLAGVAQEMDRLLMQRLQLGHGLVWRTS